MRPPTLLDRSRTAPRTKSLDISTSGRRKIHHLVAAMTLLETADGKRARNAPYISSASPYYSRGVNIMRSIQKV